MNTTKNHFDFANLLNKHLKMNQHFDEQLM